MSGQVGAWAEELESVTVLDAHRQARKEGWVAKQIIFIKRGCQLLSHRSKIARTPTASVLLAGLSVFHLIVQGHAECLTPQISALFTLCVRRCSAGEAL